MDRFYGTEWELSGPQLVYDAISADSGGLLFDSFDILITHWIFCEVESCDLVN